MHAGSDAGTKMCEVLLNRFHCEIGQHNVKDSSSMYFSEYGIYVTDETVTSR